MSGGGFGLRWPDLDEGLSTEGLLRGAPLSSGNHPLFHLDSCHRFLLSLRRVEDLQAERGILASCETIRFWCAKFGPAFACRRRAKQKSNGRHPARGRRCFAKARLCSGWDDTRSEQSTIESFEVALSTQGIA